MYMPKFFKNLFFLAVSIFARCNCCFDLKVSDLGDLTKMLTQHRWQQSFWLIRRVPGFKVDIAMLEIW